MSLRDGGGKGPLLGAGVVQLSTQHPAHRGVCGASHQGLGGREGDRDRLGAAQLAGLGGIGGFLCGGQGDTEEGDLGGGGLLEGGEDALVVRAGDGDFDRGVVGDRHTVHETEGPVCAEIDARIRRKLEAGDIAAAILDGLLNRAEVRPVLACGHIEGCRPEVHEIAAREGHFNRDLIGAGRDLILEVAGTAAAGKQKEVNHRNPEAAATMDAHLILALAGAAHRHRDRDLVGVLIGERIDDRREGGGDCISGIGVVVVNLQATIARRRRLHGAQGLRQVGIVHRHGILQADAAADGVEPVCQHWTNGLTRCRSVVEQGIEVRGGLHRRERGGWLGPFGRDGAGDHVDRLHPFLCVRHGAIGLRPGIQQR